MGKLEAEIGLSIQHALAGNTAMLEWLTGEQPKDSSFTPREFAELTMDMLAAHREAILRLAREIEGLKAADHGD
jgi:hypothetical protein